MTVGQCGSVWHAMGQSDVKWENWGHLYLLCIGFVVVFGETCEEKRRVMDDVQYLAWTTTAEKEKGRGRRED
jgi:hypothetical protein